LQITPGYFVFKNENVNLKAKYSFVLHTGFARSPSTLGLSCPFRK
jgi:hypothetical protein